MALQESGVSWSAHCPIPESRRSLETCSGTTCLNPLNFAEGVRFRTAGCSVRHWNAHERASQYKHSVVCWFQAKHENFSKKQCRCTTLIEPRCGKCRREVRRERVAGSWAAVLGGDFAHTNYFSIPSNRHFFSINEVSIRNCVCVSRQDPEVVHYRGPEWVRAIQRAESGILASDMTMLKSASPLQHVV
eukprot:gb/GECG01001037.1/.p1 GENE.gb/GECG01001037.1/~~gb/GECG01001037.1/.p1  ORF type:complete len:189 (+),score=3.20 gb/GECG01001037.1/:1-567(+)